MRGPYIGVSRNDHLLFFWVLFQHKFTWTFKIYVKTVGRPSQRVCFFCLIISIVFFFFLIFRSLAFTWSHYAQHNIIYCISGRYYLFIFITCPFWSTFVLFMILTFKDIVKVIFLIFRYVQPTSTISSQTLSVRVSMNEIQPWVSKSYHTPVWDDSSCINGNQSNQMVPQVI